MSRVRWQRETGPTRTGQRRRVENLALVPGSRVWLSVKATDLEVYTRDHSQPR